METLDLLLGGLEAALTPTNLLYAAIGVLLGTFVGVLPGIGPAMAVALLLPGDLRPRADAGVHHVRRHLLRRHVRRVDHLDPAEHTGGVLLGDDRASRATRWPRRGRAAQALATAAIGSFVAGTIGTLLVAFFAPPLADVAVEIGAPSYFAIMRAGAGAGDHACSARRRLRGFIALFLGLTIGLVGLDLNTGQARLSFEQPAAGRPARHRRRRGRDLRPRRGALGGRAPAPPAAGDHPGRAARGWAATDWGRSWKPWLRGTALGFPFGAMPAGGAEIPTFLSYVTERRLAKHRERVRQGRHRGRRRAGGRQQRLRGGHVRAAAGARPAGHRDRGGHAGRACRATASSPARS